MIIARTAISPSTDTRSPHLPALGRWVFAPVAWPLADTTFRLLNERLDRAGGQSLVASHLIRLSGDRPGEVHVLVRGDIRGLGTATLRLATWHHAYRKDADIPNQEG